MKSFASSATAACLVALLVGPRLCKAYGPEPGLQFDPDTAQPCYMWEDNAGDLDCKEVRDYWDITPEEFSRWNPSVGEDCKPWGEQSYCVVPEERLINDPRPMPTFYTGTDFDASTTAEDATATATGTTTATDTNGTPPPDPMSWEPKGCYVDDDDNQTVLEEMMDSGNYQSTGQCYETCYEAGYEIAGLRWGDQCWCGSSIDGEKADNQDECDMECPGYPFEMCGGKNRIQIFALEGFDGTDEDENADEQNEEEQVDDNAEDNDDAGDDAAEDDEVVEDEGDDEEEASQEATETTPSGTGAVVETEAPESGASRNKIWFF